MKTAELREKSVEELNEELKSLLREQFNLRMQNTLGEKPKAHVFRNARRNIAVVKTILHEKALKSTSLEGA